MRRYIIGKIFRRLGYDIKRINAKKKEDLLTYKCIYHPEILESKRFYNIGAGTFTHPYWTTIDLQNEWYRNNPVPDINFDFMSLKPLPIESNSALLFYTTHVLEHITDEAVQNILNESYRALRNNGLIRIIVPDTDLDLSAWLRNDEAHFDWIYKFCNIKNQNFLGVKYKPKDLSITQVFLYNFASDVSLIHKDETSEKITDSEFKRLYSTMSNKQLFDYCTSKCSLERQRKYACNHINWFNEKKLTEMLKRAGFAKIYRSGYGQSRVTVLKNLTYFDICYYKSSLFMEAVK